MKLACLLFLAVIGHLHGSPLNIQFSDPRYTKLTELRVRNCRENVITLINQALAGGKKAIEIPTTNKGKPHVSCFNDPVMGPSVQFTIYKNDNDPNNETLTDRQRLEMKVGDPSPTSYQATLNTNYVYTWWFKLGQGMVVGNGFFHIFQLKANKANNVPTMPLFTLSLTNKERLHMRVNRKGTNTLNPKDDHLNLLPLKSVVGNWIQATVEVNYSNSPSTGYVNVSLKSETGRQLVTKKTSFKTYWTKAAFVRPKWGLYRATNSVFKQSDTELFQNVQIWKRK